MNCKTLRELYTANPRCGANEAIQHLQECGACSEWVMELQAFEVQLSDAMLEEIPKGLEERILKRCENTNKTAVTPIQRAHRWWQPALAIAASLLLVVSLISTLNVDSQSETQIERQMLAWLSEQQPNQYSDQQAPDAEVERMFNEIGAELVADIGTVRHCRVTRVANHKVGYFVLSGNQGPVSIIVMSDGSKKLYLQNEGGENTRQIEQRIQQSIHWI